MNKFDWKFCTFFKLVHNHIEGQLLLFEIILKKGVETLTHYFLSLQP